MPTLITVDRIIFEAEMRGESYWHDLSHKMFPWVHTVRVYRREESFRAEVWLQVPPDYLEKLCLSK